MDDLLHVYGQFAWHDDVFLIGDRDALMKLRDAVDQALEKGAGSFTGFVTDGEGFECHVHLADEKELLELKLPYCDHDIQFGDDDKQFPRPRKA